MLRNGGFHGAKEGSVTDRAPDRPGRGREEPEMADELKELEELKKFEEVPPLWGWYLNIFPTQHLQVLGWAFSHRKGARLPDVKVRFAMTSPSLSVSVVFLGITGSPWEITYYANTVNSIRVTRRPRDAWQLVEAIYAGLPLRSQR